MTTPENRRESAAASSRRWLRRQNRRLRWTQGNCTLHHHAPHPAHRKIRWDTVRMLLRTRQWRLALTVAAMPCGYALSRAADKSGPGQAPSSLSGRPASETETAGARYLDDGWTPTPDAKEDHA